jgi:tRNA(Ile)-lysidine synthetase-like protein
MYLMECNYPAPGAYTIAVSGGVDSVSLLHLLATKAAQAPAGWQLVVAHFDHGIRPNSADDRKFVAGLARDYRLQFTFAAGQLGPKASEAQAREARYHFLRTVQRDNGSRAIITAHHRDDLLETAILNLLRGTGRKGLTSLASQPDLLRPLLATPKQDIAAYARGHRLRWREDKTNADQRYRRNYVRHALIAGMDETAKNQLWLTIQRQQQLNEELEQLLASQLSRQGGALRRDWFIQLPHEVAREVMAGYLRSQGIGDFDSKALERLVVGAKVAPDGKRLDVRRGQSLSVSREYLALTPRER